MHEAAQRRQEMPKRRQEFRFYLQPHDHLSGPQLEMALDMKRTIKECWNLLNHVYCTGDIITVRPGRCEKELIRQVFRYKVGSVNGDPSCPKIILGVQLGSYKDYNKHSVLAQEFLGREVRCCKNDIFHAIGEKCKVKNSPFHTPDFRGTCGTIMVLRGGWGGGGVVCGDGVVRGVGGEGKWGRFVEDFQLGIGQGTDYLRCYKGTREVRWCVYEGQVCAGGKVDVIVDEVDGRIVRIVSGLD
ncbi:hypothetical protein Tco_0099092 [Tanacetum coccineum]